MSGSNVWRRVVDSSTWPCTSKSPMKHKVYPIQANTLSVVRKRLFLDVIYSAVTGIVNVVIFAAYSSRCAVYFEKCGQRCTLLKGSIANTCVCL